MKKKLKIKNQKKILKKKKKKKKYILNKHHKKIVKIFICKTHFQKNDLTKLMLDRQNF